MIRNRLGNTDFWKFLFGGSIAAAAIAVTLWYYVHPHDETNISDPLSAAKPIESSSEHTIPSAVVQKARESQFAFYRSKDGRFRTRGSLHRASISESGVCEFTPSLPEPQDGQKPDEVTSTIETSSISRDAGETAPVASEIAIRESGQLAITRDDIVETFRMEESGLRQEWEFADKPSGSGPLNVRVRLDGYDYAGASSTGLHFSSEGMGLLYSNAVWVDRKGKRTQILPRFTDNQITFSVPAKVIEETEYPAILDPVISPEFGIDDPVLAPARLNQGTPDIAFDGTNYLAVYISRRSDVDRDFSIYAMRIDPSGNLLDPAGFPVHANDEEPRDPGVACNPSGCLVAWTENVFQYPGEPQGVYAKRVATSGYVYPQLIQLSDDENLTEYMFDVESNGQNFLVVWTSESSKSFSGEDILGTRISNTGARLDSTPFYINDAADTQTETSNQVDSVCVGTDGAGYLVAWSGRTASGSARLIYATRVSSAGKMLDSSELQLSTGADPRHDTPTIAYGGNGRYLVLWYEYTYEKTSFKSRWVSTDGTLDPEGERVVYSGKGRAPRMTFNGETFLIVYDGIGAVSALQLDASGVLLSAEPIVIYAEQTGYMTEPVIATNMDTFMAMFDEDIFAGYAGWDAFATPILKDGTVVYPGGAVVSVSAADQNYPSVAYGNETYFTVWVDGRRGAADIYGSRIAEDGTILDPVAIPVTTNATLPKVAFNGTYFIVVWCKVISTLQNTEIWGRLVSPDGTLVGSEFPINTHLSRKYEVDVACNDEQCLVVWGDERNYSRREPDPVVPSILHEYSGDIYGTRLLDDGTVLDSDGAAIESRVKNQTEPAVATDGSDFFITWMDKTNVGLDIRGRVVDANLLSISGTDAISVIVGYSIAGSPVIAYGNGEYLIVWQDDRNWNLTYNQFTDVMGQRLSQSGVPLDLNPFPVIKHAGVQEDPFLSFNGKNFVVLWSDYRNGNTSDLYATTIGSGGLNHYPTGFALSSYPEFEGHGASVTGSMGKTLVVYERFDQGQDFQAVRVRARFLEEKENGAVCAQGIECASGYCADSRCCDGPCSAGCDACSVLAGAVEDGKCSLLSSGTTCRGSAGGCDRPEQCTGVDASCPPDIYQTSSYVCRPAAGSCDRFEKCTGASAFCPADMKLPNTTVCRFAAGVCDSTEQCNGVSDICPADTKSSSVCRASSGICDIAEICDGYENDCPSDSIRADGEVCRGSSGSCDLEELCDGVLKICPPDAKSTSMCRGIQGVCDLEEYCDGVNSACPSDRKSTALCRSSAGVCDREETCNGISNDCPMNQYWSGMTMCREAAGPCDAQENCSGLDIDCPEDLKRSMDSVCRPQGFDCDIQENCTGSSDECPVDDFLVAGESCMDSDPATEDDICALDGSCSGVPKDGTCLNPIAVNSFPFTKLWNGTGRVSQIATYGTGCVRSDWPEGEFVFRVEVPEASVLEISLQSDVNAEAGIMILSECGSGVSCLASINRDASSLASVIEYEADPTHAIFVVVEFSSPDPWMLTINSVIPPVSTDDSAGDSADTETQDTSGITTDSDSAGDTMLDSSTAESGKDTVALDTASGSTDDDDSATTLSASCSCRFSRPFSTDSILSLIIGLW